MISRGLLIVAGEATSALSSSSTSGVLCAKVLGSGLIRISPEKISEFRRRPGSIPEAWKRVTPSLLRYSDEQSIAGVAAIFAAITPMACDPLQFEDWGVVAASRFLGRANLSVVLRRFAAEGVWGTSPHLIPHFALHSPSGTISLALGTHGPNLGVGGGLHSPCEGFLAAMTWLEMGIVPGVWLVFTGWSPELTPSPEGIAAASGECLALAIALTKQSGPEGVGFHLDLGQHGRPMEEPLDLIGLHAALGSSDTQAGPTTIATDSTGSVRVRCVPCFAKMAGNHE